MAREFCREHARADSAAFYALLEVKQHVQLSNSRACRLPTVCQSFKVQRNVRDSYSRGADTSSEVPAIVAASRDSSNHGHCTGTRCVDPGSCGRPRAGKDLVSRGTEVCCYPAPLLQQQEEGAAGQARDPTV